MFAAIAITAAVALAAGSVLGYIFGRSVMTDAQSIKSRVAAEISSVKSHISVEITSLRADLKGVLGSAAAKV